MHNKLLVSCAVRAEAITDKQKYLTTSEQQSITQTLREDNKLYGNLIFKNDQDAYQYLSRLARQVGLRPQLLKKYENSQAVLNAHDAISENTAPLFTNKDRTIVSKYDTTTRTSLKDLTEFKKRMVSAASNPEAKIAAPEAAVDLVTTGLQNIEVQPVTFDEKVLGEMINDPELNRQVAPALKECWLVPAELHVDEVQKNHEYYQQWRDAILHSDQAKLAKVTQIAAVRLLQRSEELRDPAFPIKALYQTVHSISQLLHFAAKFQFDMYFRPQEAHKTVEKTLAVLESLYNMPRAEKVVLGTDVAFDMLTQHGLTVAGGAGLHRLAKVAKEAKAAAKIISKLEPIAQDAAKLAEVKNIEQAATNEIKLIEALEKADMRLPLETNLNNGKDIFNFTKTTSQRMATKSRMIPIQILKEIIENPLAIAKDPQGTNALMYYSQMWKDGKLYNVEVLYDKSTNQIMHFLYKQEGLGPLQRIK
jgi:hypothetical protein